MGLSDVADQRVGAFSLGMGQRLGVAAALLGDPATLVLDEPVNGLDLDGIRWIRSLLKELAAEGRTIFLSSHLMSEMAVTADHVIVVGQGRLLRDQPMADFIDDAAVETVRVRASDVERLARLVQESGGTVDAATARCSPSRGSPATRSASGRRRHGSPSSSCRRSRPPSSTPTSRSPGTPSTTGPTTDASPAREGAA